MNIPSFNHRRKSDERMSSAFTIIELLIVIVIIAILAAITIISYVGIQNRAKASAAQTLLSQTVSKVRLYAVDHSDTYPSSLSAAGITNTDGLQYSSSSSSPSTFCITATSQNVSYYQSSTTSAPTAGACPGHGVNGGGVVVNYALNPSFESNFNGASVFRVANSTATDNPKVGLKFLRSTRTTTETANWGPWLNAATNLVPGEQYVVSLYARSNVSVSHSLVIEWFKDDSYAERANNSGTTGVVSGIPDSSWTYFKGTVVVPSDATAMRLTFYAFSDGTTNDFVDIDAVMITKGKTVYSFADGNTENWAWTGTPNNSTSIGPAP